MKRILVTGGAGFIGSAMVRHLIHGTTHAVANVDKLTYAANLGSLPGIHESERYRLYREDIVDASRMGEIFKEFLPEAVVHLAAESHVDRSIDGPLAFLNTNVMGTYALLQATREYLDGPGKSIADRFRFLHVSTDEVYGDLEEGYFSETTPYAPSSPYSASKAASDHLVRAWHRTFGVPTMVTHCSNNYGPYHFPEKFIPHMILNALSGKSLPLYGDGQQVRDWLHVEDHVAALCAVLERGRVGETYDIGGASERMNLRVAEAICDQLDQAVPSMPPGITRHRDLIEFVTDRPGHDRRYAIDSSKIREELGWTPSRTFEEGLRATVDWYLSNRSWWEKVLNGDYRLERLGRA